MEKIKLPRSSYEELTRIIISYAHTGRPASLDDIVKASGTHFTVVSANNAFLSILQIIQGGKKKAITPKGVKLAKALEHEMAEETEEAWAEIINESDFLSKILQAVRIRKGMDQTQLENHIAFSSGEQKTTAVMTGSKCVVDLLLASGQLKVDGDKYVATMRKTEVETSKEPIIDNKEDTEDAANLIVSNKKIELIDHKLGGINLKIELRINASPNELDGLGKKIKSIIDELKEE